MSIDDAVEACGAPLRADQLAFRARALAQAHPLTPLAQRFVSRAVAQQRTEQSMDEVSDWAATALVTGYCVRRVEEASAPFSFTTSDPAPSLDSLGAAAEEFAAALRSGARHAAGGFAPGDDENTIRALDRIVESEMDRRREMLREVLDDTAWEELEAYVTWWVVTGYALRAAETTMATRA